MILSTFRARPGTLIVFCVVRSPAICPSSSDSSFVINLKTAKAFGVEISPTLFVAADEVIE
jgi:hypothetical protein